MRRDGNAECAPLPHALDALPCAVMHCPACQKATTETAEVCECGFSMAALDQMLGIAPQLMEGVTDMTKELRPRQVRGIQRQIERLERVFPQVRFAMVMCHAPAKIPLPLYLFWLFNRGGLSSAVERAGMNRLIMLAIDTAAGNAASMIGYGLEPFLAQDQITACLQAMQPLLAAQQHGRAIEAFLLAMERQLIDSLADLDTAFGIGKFEYQGLAHLLDSEDQATVAY